MLPKRPLPFLLCIFLLLCVTTQKSQAQAYTIKGTVTDAATDEPIAGANIFISNTSKGTVSDAQGFFALHDIPAGKYELVISYSGYETIVYSFSSEKPPLRLNVKMEVKVKEWETVNVTPFEKDGWEKWGRLFTNAFLGETPNATHCTIKNKEAIRFRYHKTEGILEAVADTLLVIENRALGYMLYYELAAFQYNTRQRSVIYGGYPLFKEIPTERKGKQKKYMQARSKAYYGSTMHFMRALFRNQLAAEGYEVRSLRSVANEEKLRMKKLYPVKQIFSNDGRTVRVEMNGGNGLPKDSVDYYRQVMDQPDTYEIIGGNLLTADSLLTPGHIPDYQVFTFPHELLVIYKNEEPAIEYSRWRSGPKDRWQTTRLFFTPEAETRLLNVYANGSYFNPLELFLNGYMGWEKIAELLPLDYEPGKE